jgi:hypothetical protein
MVPPTMRAFTVGAFSCAIVVAGYATASAQVPPAPGSPGAFGLTFGLADQDFGGGADLVNVRESVWYARGALKGGLSFEAGRLFERSSAGFEQANTLAAGLSLSWRPPRLGVGAFGVVRVSYASFDKPAMLGDRGWTDLSVGAEFPVERGQLPLSFVRLGYTRIFDDRTPYRNALLVSVDARFATW